MLKISRLFVCVEGFMAQSTQWGHVKRGQFIPNHTFTGQA